MGSLDLNRILAGGLYYWWGRGREENTLREKRPGDEVGFELRATVRKGDDRGIPKMWGFGNRFSKF